MRSIGPSMVSPVATSSTRSTDSSSPPSLMSVANLLPSQDGEKESSVVWPDGSICIGSINTRDSPSGSTV